MLQQQPGMVSSQMGPGGMQYRAPVVPQAANDPVRQQAARQEPIVFGGTWNQNIDSGW